MTPRPPSLARRLVIGAVLWIAASIVAGGSFLSFSFARSAAAAFDARLDSLVLALVAVSEIDGSGRVFVARALGETRFERVFSGWCRRALIDQIGRMERTVGHHLARAAASGAPHGGLARVEIAPVVEAIVSALRPGRHRLAGFAPRSASPVDRRERALRCSASVVSRPTRARGRRSRTSPRRRPS